MSEWETLGWVAHDSYLAIADASIPVPKKFEALQATDIENRVIDATQQGVSVIAAFREDDDNVPVVVRRDRGGQIVSLRLCWTTDVDELDGSGDGSWQESTTLSLPKGSCVVWDPFHGEIEHGNVVDVKPGDYSVEIFYTEADCLAMRLVQTGSDHGKEMP